MRYDGGMRCLSAIIFAGSVATIALACGGASDQEVLSESSTSSSSGSSSGTTTASSSGSPSTSSSSGTTSSGGTTSSSGSSGTTETDAGKPTPGTCTPETELNNEPSTANTLAGSVCGSLLPSTELDFLTFTLKQGTKTMDFTFTGNVKIRIFVEGHDVVELTPQSNPPIPFVIGKPYLVRIGANGQTAPKVDWRVNLVTS